MSPVPVSFATETWKVVTPGAIADHGNEVPDWDHPADERTVEGCTSWPGPSSDTSERRDGVQVQHTVLLPDGDPVDRRKGLRDPDGDLWLIVGKPARWRSPPGRLNCVAVELIQWEG